MIQIFLKPSLINEQNWSIAYQKIGSILTHFPTKIIRLESYNGYSPHLDKKHFDLVVDKDTENEHLSFWGDWLSYTGSVTVRFYKSWKQQLEKESVRKEINENKSITWFPHEAYKNDGSLPEANGLMPCRYQCISTEGAHYVCVLIAIGTMLENLIPDGAFMTVWDEKEETVSAVVDWLEEHFQENFELPIFFDKPRLLASFINEYPNKKEAACRIAHLFRNKHKQNMEFLMEHLGYEATFAFYTEVLADTGFGTFGFNDILMPWIAVTKDLENTIDLVLASKNWLLQNPDKATAATKYNLTYILEQLLDNYILWTPEQREQLAHFYTNETALETGEEDLFGIMRRMMGYRVDICPIFSTQYELFESFMYKVPKQGKVFKDIIDNWVIENDGKYDDLKEKLQATFEKKLEKEAENKTADETALSENELAEKIEQQNEIDAFVSTYKTAEQYFVKAAITLNPNFIGLPKAIKQLKQQVIEVIEGEEHQAYVQKVRKLSKERFVKAIKSRIKEIGYAVHPDFEKWLQAENNEEVLFYLHFLTALKLYDRDSHFTRFRILWDKLYWKNWT